MYTFIEKISYIISQWIFYLFISDQWTYNCTKIIDNMKKKNSIKIKLVSKQLKTKQENNEYANMCSIVQGLWSIEYQTYLLKIKYSSDMRNKFW